MYFTNLQGALSEWAGSDTVTNKRNSLSRFHSLQRSQAAERVPRVERRAEAWAVTYLEGLRKVTLSKRNFIWYPKGEQE